MFGWLAGAESDQDSQETRAVTRSGKFTEKAREEAIQRAETEKSANESNKRYRKYVKSLEKDQNPAQVPPGGDTPPTDEELGEQQEQDLPQDANIQQAGGGAGGDGSGDGSGGSGNNNPPTSNNTQGNMAIFEDENGVDDVEWYKRQ